MKTKEFIRQVEELGFEIRRRGVVLVIRSKGSEEVANVSTKTEGAINTRFPYFVSMVKEKKDKLFCILIEYSSTPIEERKEEKKYYIRHKHLAQNLSYLNLEDFGGYLFSTKVCTSDHKTQFTLAELPDWVHEILEQGHLVKEEVE